MTEKTNHPIVVTTTFEDRQEAEKLVDILLQERLIACAQIGEPVSSAYWWNDEITRSSEYTVVMKSTSELFQRLEKAIKINHSYDVPEIIAVPIVKISDDYRIWLEEELSR
jgi:periplasmic divalent cation tolerance protein